jgi:predicted transposase/invertase (TIGR01784 family)
MEVCLYNDFAFKWLFGREQKKKPIISLLNAVVGAENNETVFSDIRIPTPFDATKFAEEKQGILDLRVKDELTGTWGDVEIQVRYQHYYPERAMYYLAGMYREQLIAGNNYGSLSSLQKLIRFWHNEFL